MSQWFKRQRQIWIGNRLLEQGDIRRFEICDHFDISPQQASVDLAAFMAANPGVIFLDRRAKRYRLTDSTRDRLVTP